MKTTIAKAHTYITSFIRANVPVNLIGSPGLGKSDVIKQVGENLNLKVIDFRLSTADPTDLSGLPFINEGRSVFLPNEAFPIASDPLPAKLDSKGKPVMLPKLSSTGQPVLDGENKPVLEPAYYDGWLLFLDEISNAPMAVQAAAYKLILDREVGLHKLHERVRIVSAGNKIDDGAAVTGEMSTALKSRMAHLNIELSIDDWLEWALVNNVSHEITSYIKFQPTELYRFDPKVDADTFPCPRTWAMADRVVKVMGISNAATKEMVSAVLSDGTATNFINYCKNFVGLPTYQDIVADPMGTKIPKDNLAAMFALSGSIGAQTKKETVGAVMQYIARMPSEFQVRTFHDFIRRDATLVADPGVRSWLATNAKHLIV